MPAVCWRRLNSFVDGPGNENLAGRRSRLSSRCGIHHSADRRQIRRRLELVGTSTKSWEDAASAAVARASTSLRDLRVAEVVKLDLQIKDGKVEAYRAKISVSFKYEDKVQTVKFDRLKARRSVDLQLFLVHDARGYVRSGRLFRASVMIRCGSSCRRSCAGAAARPALSWKLLSMDCLIGNR